MRRHRRSDMSSTIKTPHRLENCS